MLRSVIDCRSGSIAFSYSNKSVSSIRQPLLATEDAPWEYILGVFSITGVEMEFLCSLIEWAYRVGATMLFSHSRENAAMRIMLIGLVTGMIGILPLSIAVVLSASFVSVFALWHPSLREVSGFYFKMTAVLVLMLFVVWSGRNLIA